MTDRVRELRRRLAPVLEVVSESARRDLEELFALASRPADESVRLLREVRAALDLVERATGVATEPRPRKRTQPNIRALLIEIWRERQGAMSARDLAGLVRERTPDVEFDEIRRALERPEFRRVGRFRYELAVDPQPAAESPPKAARGRGQPAAAALRKPLAPEAPPSPARETEEERDQPTLLDRLRAVLAREQRPLTPTEIADHLLAGGWTTRSPRPRNVISAALGKYPEFERAYGKCVPSRNVDALVT